MAAGQVIGTVQSVATGAFLDLRPAAGIEWVVQNIHHAAGAEVYHITGSVSVRFMSDTGEGSWQGLVFRCSNAVYYRVKNTDAATKVISYDGLQTK